MWIALYLVVGVVVGVVMWRTRDPDAPYSPTAGIITAGIWGLLWPIAVVQLAGDVLLGWIPADGWNPWTVFFVAATPLVLVGAAAGVLTGSVVGPVIGAVAGVVAGVVLTTAERSRRQRR